jgi:hypothetical protein
VAAPKHSHKRPYNRWFSQPGAVHPNNAPIAAGAVRSYALPDVSTEFAGLSGAQTFDGDKTFAGATAAGATKTVNLGTGGVAGSDTVNIGSDVPGADGTTVINLPTVTFANGVTVVGMPQANLTALLLGLGGGVADAHNRLSINAPAVLLKHAGAVFEKEITTDRPASNQSLAPRLFTNNGATAAAVAFDCSGVYLETDY